MKKTLLSLFALFALAFTCQATFAACPCQTQPACPCEQSACPCDTGAACPCDKKPCKCQDKTPCCEDWLCPQTLEDYFCRIGLSECQKADARKAVEEFKCETQALRDKGCKCESKCECRSYRKALRKLDCKMKNIITKCQKSDYKCVRKEVKAEVKCCHKCLINPFKRCKCGCS